MEIDDMIENCQCLINYEQKTQIEALQAEVDSLRFQIAESSGTSRLISYLVGHVLFLNRLAETPELQSLFLVSEVTGSMFLPETTLRMVLEQASRTTKFLCKFDEEKKDSAFQMGNIFNYQVDFKNRVSNVSKLLEEENPSSSELKALLLQEVVITSLLRKRLEFVEAEASKPKIDFTRGESTKELLFSRESAPNEQKKLHEEIEKLNKDLNETLRNQSNNRELQDEVEKLKKELKRKERIEVKYHELQEDIARIKEDREDSKQLTQFEIDKLKEKNQRLKKELKSLKEDQESLQSAREIKLTWKKKAEDLEDRKTYSKLPSQNENTSQNRSTITTVPMSDWEKWAKKVYLALMGVNAPSASTADYRFAIEEAALVSVGGRKSTRKRRPKF